MSDDVPRFYEPVRILTNGIFLAIWLVFFGVMKIVSRVLRAGLR